MQVYVIVYEGRLRSCYIFRIIHDLNGRGGHA